MDRYLKFTMFGGNDSMKLYLINNVCVSLSPITGTVEVEIKTTVGDNPSNYINKRIIIFECGHKSEAPSQEELLIAENFMLKQNQLDLEACLINLEKNILTGWK